LSENKHPKSKKRKQRHGTHSVSLQTVQQLEGKFCLTPGEKLCRTCWMHIKSTLDDHDSAASLSLSEEPREFSESSSTEEYLSLLDDSLAACGVSPFKSIGKSKCQKLFHANKKIEKVTK